MYIKSKMFVCVCVWVWTASRSGWPDLPGQIALGKRAIGTN